MSATWSRPKDSNFWPSHTVDDVEQADRELKYWLEVEKALGPCFKLHGWTGVDRAAFWFIRDGAGGAGGGYHKPIEVPGEVANVLVPIAVPK